MAPTKAKRRSHCLKFATSDHIGISAEPVLDCLDEEVDYGGTWYIKKEAQYIDKRRNILRPYDGFHLFMLCMFYYPPNHSLKSLARSRATMVSVLWSGCRVRR